MNKGIFPRILASKEAKDMFQQVIQERNPRIFKDPRGYDRYYESSYVPFWSAFDWGYIQLCYGYEAYNRFNNLCHMELKPTNKDWAIVESIALKNGIMIKKYSYEDENYKDLWV